MSGKGKGSSSASGGGGAASADEAAMVLQVLQAQSSMQTLLLDGFMLSFAQCTSAGSVPQLSAKEKRCIQQGMANYIDARSHIAQHMAALQQARGGDF